MSVIIRLQGLPWSANALDIRRYFQSLSIPDGGVHIIGGEKGDAFIAFSSDEDARQAMQRDGKVLNEYVVKLLLSSKSEMQNVITVAQGGGQSQAPAASPEEPLPPMQPSFADPSGQGPPLSQGGQMPYGNTHSMPSQPDYHNSNRHVDVMAEQPVFQQDQRRRMPPPREQFQQPDRDVDPWRNEGRQNNFIPPGAQNQFQTPPISQQVMMQPPIMMQNQQARPGMYPQQDFPPDPRSQFRDGMPMNQGPMAIPYQQRQGPRDAFMGPGPNEPMQSMHGGGPPQFGGSMHNQYPQPQENNFQPDFQQRNNQVRQFSKNIDPPDFDRSRQQGGQPFGQDAGRDRRVIVDRRFDDRNQQQNQPAPPKPLQEPLSVWYVEIKGMPVGTEVKELRMFLGNHEISRSNILLMIDPKGKKNGNAFVRLANQFEFEHALKLKGKSLDGRFVEVLPSNEQTFLDACDFLEREELRLSTPNRPRIRKKVNRSKSRSRSRSPMDHFCVEFKNLSPKTERPDVRDMLRGIGWLERSLFVKFDDRGTCTGTAFGEVLTRDDYTQVLAFHGRKRLLDRIINVYPIERTKMDSLIDKHRQRFKREPDVSSQIRDSGFPPIKEPIHGLEAMRKEVKLRTPSNKEDYKKFACVQIRGIPFQSTIKDVREFFKGIHVAYRGIHMIYTKDGSCVGTAFVEFASPDNCREALKRNLQFIGARYITVKSCSKEEMIRQLDIIKKETGGRSSQEPRGEEKHDRNESHSKREESSHRREGSSSKRENSSSRHDDNTFIDNASKHVQSEDPAVSGGEMLVSNKVELRNLPFNLAEETVFRFLQEFNPVANTLEFKGKEGQPCGTATISFKTDADAKQALKAMYGVKLGGRPIKLFPLLP